MNWDEIKKEYETSKITLKALADKHDIKLGTLKSRKSREKWSRDATKKDATKQEKVATIKPIIQNDDLTDKQKLFCLYYTKYFNATKAYQKAYECAYTTAMVNGSGLLRNTKIKAEIERIKQERFQGIALDGMAVLQKYIDIAFADITDFLEFGTREVQEYGEDGEPLYDMEGNPEKRTVSFVDFKDYTEVDGTMINEVKQGREGVSIKLADKMKALDFLANYSDLLSENDKKRLQEEKIKTDIAKSQAEIDKMQGNDDDGPIEIMISRKGDSS